MKHSLGILAVLLWSSVQIFAQTDWYNPFGKEEIPVQGRCWNEEIGAKYHRLPDRAEKVVRKALWDLSCQSAGLYIKFKTNASKIQVKYTVTSGFSMPHMPATGVSGVDLYMKDADGQALWCAGKYSFGDTVRYTYDNLTYPRQSDKGNEFCLYLPLYNGVNLMEIGVPAGSHFEFAAPSKKKPVVIYGTSIAQGACASRPGMAWTNILQRKLDFPVVNLGFSGNGQLEEEFFRLLAETDASLFVIDCMPNMTEDDRVGLIADRMAKGIRILREKSQAPILLVEHDGYMGYRVSDAERSRFEKTNEQLRLCYQELKQKVDGLYYMTFEELGLSMDSQVDGVHATDLGMSQYAEAYSRKIAKILFP